LSQGKDSVMSEHLSPNREGAEGSPRGAMGQQVARIVTMCGLSLALGVGIAHYMLRHQTQVQRLMVVQLRSEIRALTGDIQRMELATTASSRKYEQLAARRDVEQEARLHAAMRRLTLLSHELDGQIDGLVKGQQECLSGFEPFRRLQMAIPYEHAAGALDRLVQSQLDDLDSLRHAIRLQMEEEGSRLALIEMYRVREPDRDLAAGRAFSSAAWLRPAPTGAPPGHSPLLDPLPQFRLEREASISVRQADDASHEWMASGEQEPLAPTVLAETEPTGSAEALTAEPVDPEALPDLAALPPAAQAVTVESNRPITVVPQPPDASRPLFFSSGRKVAPQPSSPTAEADAQPVR
jgi:hypothetical protein